MSNQDDFLNKIKAAMRLARRASTDGERVAAENAAKRLADRAGIALATVEAADAEIKTQTFEDASWKTRPGLEVGYISAVLRRHFGIVMIQNIFGNKVRMTWVGTKLNVEVAKYVYDILMRESRKAWGEVRSIRRMAQGIKYGDPRRKAQLVALKNLDRRSFLDGWFWEIHRKLEEHPLRNDLEQFSAEKADAERKFEEMKAEKDFRERQSTSGKDHDQNAVMMGVRAAQSVNLSRPCDGSGYNGRKPELTSRFSLPMASKLVAKKN